MPTLPLTLAVHVDSRAPVDVHRFAVEQRMSSLFEVKVTAFSPDDDLDFDGVVGRPASFAIRGGAEMHVPLRFWTGLCRHIELVAVAPGGLSTYELTIVPTLWLATQRRNHRMFQQLSELDIARKILAEWGIEPEVRVAGVYAKREYRVQYGEPDYAFLCRMLEEAGISFFFEQGDAETRLVLTDAPQSAPPRPPLPFRDDTTLSGGREYVTKLHVGQKVRPGRVALRDHDTRLAPTYPLLTAAEAQGEGVERRLEQFHYAPGAFSFGTEAGEDLPVGDDRGKTRSDQRAGGALAMKRLEAKRSSAKACSFETNVPDLAPGVVTHVLDHPRSDLTGKPLLVVASSLRGDAHGEWMHRCEARRADLPYRPRLATRKPKISGVESATVVGPAGEEIHTDELGRVRVHFHWDRESRMDQHSSCWIHVSHPWGGAGYGGSNLPRVGQEVLVDFLGGDPDRPIITGRVYTSLQKTPYKLPENKTQSGWKSNSSPTTGGYNELMFEDAAGRELVRMQAEKDLHKLVKNDEQVTIGHDRTKQVDHDDALTVGNDQRIRVGHDRIKEIGVDQSEIIGSNKSIQVGMNHTEQIGANETLMIGKNETLMVGGNRAKTVGGSQNESVGVNKSIEVGASHSEAIGGAMSLTVGAAKTETVGLTSAETVGLAKSLTVGGAYAIVVGATMNTTVAGLSAEQVGLTKSINVGAKLSIECGASKLTMDKAGHIVIEASDMKIKASGQVKIDAAGSVDVESSGPVKVKGGTISMN